MKTSSLESKTVRPGLGMYSFYHSDRHPVVAPAPAVKTKKQHFSKGLFIAVVVLALIGFGGFSLFAKNDSGQRSATVSTKKASAPKAVAVATVPAGGAATVSKIDHCANNKLPKLAVVDITDRHMWACEGTKQVRDFKVITGMQNIPENATPPGTFKVYAKQQDTALSGTSSTGSWREPVDFWMPYLDNEYGTYGFHDAGWRDLKEFGNTDPYSTKGSHGCVQLSKVDMAWVYGWAEPGTTVTITL